MARVGSVDFTASYHGPHQRAQYWREVINRETWEHAFHPLNERLPRPSYKDLKSASKDAQLHTVQLLRNSFQVGRDDFGMSYLDGRQRPTGMPKDETRPANATFTSIPQGEAPVKTATLPLGVRAHRSSGALQMAATLAAARGESDFGRSDRLPTVRAPAYSNRLAGWGSTSAPLLRAGETRRAPSFSRILNA
ncbi:unnamed protein product [Effrenium voratum]|uniref:Uncharacterized protein n=1 Tax=Effrenium voratum TaxID=2562239 RepID=A0AA36HS36_9DINO|nr:unnamed protein product [Effrenium voratum]